MIKRKHATTLLFLFLAGSLMLGLSACGSSEDEMALRSNLRDMRQAISSNKADVLMKFVDESYKSPAHPNINALRNFVNSHLSRNRVIHIYLADINVEIDGDTATIVFFSGTADGPDKVPERGRLFKVGTRWLKTNGQWLLTQAKWRPALIPRN